MKLSDVMAMTPESLATNQRNLLREAVVTRLRQVATSISKGDYDKVRDELSVSLAGDGYGCDNHYIDFDDLGGGEDLSDVLDCLENLERIIGDTSE